MILTELRQRLDRANEWVMARPEAQRDRDTYWTGPTLSAISIACRAAWGDGVSIYASGVGHRDMAQWCYDPQQQAPQDRFVCVPEGGPSRAAHYKERELAYNLGRYDVACVRYEQSGPPTLLLAAESEWGSARDPRANVLEDFDKLRRSTAAFRVMVYTLEFVPIDGLVERIYQKADTRPGGTYLFAAFNQGGGLTYLEFTP